MWKVENAKALSKLKEWPSLEKLIPNKGIVKNQTTMGKYRQTNACSISWASLTAATLSAWNRRWRPQGRRQAHAGRTTSDLNPSRLRMTGARENMIPTGTRPEQEDRKNLE
jgi:hypothetical protein